MHSKELTLISVQFNDVLLRPVCPVANTTSALSVKHMFIHEEQHLTHRHVQTGTGTEYTNRHLRVSTVLEMGDSNMVGHKPGNTDILGSLLPTVLEMGDSNMVGTQTWQHRQTLISSSVPRCLFCNR